MKALPMPTTTDEAWRRTDIRRLKLDEIGPSVNGDAATVGEYPGLPGQAIDRQKRRAAICCRSMVVTRQYAER
jgi:hypothetical protein